MNRFLIFITLIVWAIGLPAFVGDGESNVFEITETPVEESLLPTILQTTFMGPASPNPFRGGARTQISVNVKAGETAICAIYNLAGRLIRSQSFAAGSHQLIWDGRDRNGKPCASGIYLLRLSSPGSSAIAKLVLFR